MELTDPKSFVSIYIRTSTESQWKHKIIPGKRYENLFKTGIH